MKTSKQPTLHPTEETSTSSPADSPANHSPWPDEEKERTMTATSGTKCYEQYAKSNPLGSWLKMCMESQAWYSPARKLRWEAKPLYLKRVSYIEKSSSIPSSKSAKTLKVQDTPSNRLLFRLVPSVRHTAETEYGLLPTVQTQGLKVCNKRGQTVFAPIDLLPTPAVMEDRRKPNDNEARTQKIMSNLNPFSIAAMLPTPTMQDFKRRGPNSKQQGLPEIFRMLPTPRAQDGQGDPNKVTNGAVHRPSGQVFSAGLRDLAGNQLLPTPKAQESRGNASADRGKYNLSDEIAKRYKPTGTTSQLNPLFVAEMMGFPVNWTLLPFLLGDKNP